MNKEEFIGKLEMVYVGDRNAFNEIVDVYDELKGDNKHLNDLLDGALKEYDRLNNIINEAKEECKSVIGNPEHTIVSKNELMKLMLNTLNKGDSNE